MQVMLGKKIHRETSYVRKEDTQTDRYKISKPKFHSY